MVILAVLEMGNCQKDQQSDEINKEGEGPVRILRISNFVWSKDYQGLFDYDSQAIEKKVIKIEGNAVVLKVNKKFELEDTVPIKNEEKLKDCLFRVINKPNHYEIHPIMVESQNYYMQKILWLVVASLPHKQHQIQERDIFKLGKQKVKVREIVHADMNASTAPQNTKLSKLVYDDLKQVPQLPKTQLAVEEEQHETKSVVTNSEQVCRICLDPGQYTNPLITPCKCSGSVKYIHLNCLKAWLAKRLNVMKSQFCITINWLPLSCEMCKAPFRYRIYMDNKKFYTVDIPKPPKPYVILELMRKQTANKGKIFHFVSFAQKNKINLGRRKDVDVKISDDISISRIHASIEYTDGKFALSDNKSKFGTLVLVKKGIISRPKHLGISIQIGAEVFSFDAIREDKKSDFEPEDGNGTYFVDEQSEEDEDSQEDNEEEASNEDPMINEQEIDDSISPQIRNRVSPQQAAE